MPLLRRSAVVLIAAVLAASSATAQKQKIQFENLGPKAPRISFLGETPARWAEGGKHLSVKQEGGRVLVDPVTFEKAAGSEESRPAESRPGGRRSGGGGG